MLFVTIILKIFSHNKLMNNKYTFSIYLLEGNNKTSNPSKNNAISSSETSKECKKR